MSDDIAIKVEHVSKSFKLPHEKTSSIKGAVLNFRKRKRTFERHQVLKDVSFEIKRGEFFGIVGRNGSGKSTLLKILAQIYATDAGAVSVDGSLTPFIELGVGFSPELTGRENVYLNGALLGFSRAEMEAMYSDIVAFAELEDFMDQKLKNYSSGMQVRLAFSIAIRARSDILILDEVLAVGDEAFQKKCNEYFTQLKNQSQTIVLVTHDMSSVERFCDRALVLDKGEMIGVFDTYEAQKIYTQLNRNGRQKGQNEIVKVEQRWGSGAATFDSIKVAGGHGKAPVVKQGEKLELIITIKTRSKQPLPVTVGLGFYDAANTYIAGPNSQRQGLNSDKEIRYSVDTNPLNPGKYRLEAALFDDVIVEEYDHMVEALSFEVTSDAVGPVFGKIDLFGTWKGTK